MVWHLTLILVMVSFYHNCKIEKRKLQGIVVEARMSRQLPDVEQYLGIPYAAAPVGKLRFMPPGSAPQWKQKLKIADSFGPVCPQRFPNKRNMPPERQEYFQRIERHLRNQSEDCLYLNIYSPVQDPDNPRMYPVMVYLHGGDFEWDAGSTYDGSVLAAYGHVIVITLNFRLGILGFLKPGLEDESRSNFGLIDQIAALLWIQDNIDKFGGDPNSVTLFGQGSGAVCANFLMMSPMIIKEGDKLLFHRAILMSGTALSDWALVKNPTHVTLQVAKAVRCPSNGKELEECLRKRRLEDLMDISISIPEYQTPFGPIIDQTVIPNYPKHIMSAYNDIFKRFELIYGVMEVESAHLLNTVAMAAGMLQEETNSELRKYFETKFEANVGFILAHTLSAYSRFVGTDNKLNSYDGQSYDSAFLNRDYLLNILSDVRTVAPVTLMAKLHSALNLNSYFYVFGHKTASNYYYRTKSIPGDELPYVFGVPIDGPRIHFQDRYSEEEQIFSEVVMTYFTNFAHTGDPNIPRRNDFYTMHPLDWKRFSVDWINYDSQGEPFMYLKIPPQIGFHYRHREVAYWNEEMPKLLEERKEMKIAGHALPGLNPPPVVIPRTFPGSFSPKQNMTYGGELMEETERIQNEDISRSVLSTEPSNNGTVRIVIAVGTLFLLTNVVILALLYYKCVRLKKRDRNRSTEMVRVRNDELFDPDFEGGQPAVKKKYAGCRLMKMITKSNKSEDTYEAVKINEGVCSTSKLKLIRQMSSSTIDPHSKVRDWISQEVAQKGSPRSVRKSKIGNHSKQNSVGRNEPISGSDILQNADSTSTINRSPTRPVSPTENTSDMKEHNNSKLSNSTSAHKPPSRKFFSKSHVRSISKTEKVSVAVDATPSGRGSSVLRQQPIELTKSFEFNRSFDHQEDSETNLRRSATLDDVNRFSNNDSLRRSSTSINLKIPENGWDLGQPTIVKIEHHHSKSDPVRDTEMIFPRIGVPLKRLRSFDPQQDVNVTSRDDVSEQLPPLTHEQQLMTIKRRNFPKVLPDHPGRRMSMPTSNQLFHTIPEAGFISSLSQPTSPNRLNCRFPPAPPPRTTSSLGRNSNRHTLIHSHAVLAEEPPEIPEPEITCNNLYVGPLLPVKGIKKPNPFVSTSENRLNTQPIYDNLNPKTTPSSETTNKTINPDNSVIRLEPKIITKPSTLRKPRDLPRNKNVPRVTLGDSNLRTTMLTKQSSLDSVSEDQRTESTKETVKTPQAEKESAGEQCHSQDVLLKQNKKDTDISSSDSSEASDTGTVVNKS
ncbi:neuroligin-4, Y-linked isoform X2 [Agrilus planipennis]|uniref:Neuroligin-4, Y-linked isoform X2 n=1 Tax=Agrilus planipennis TaxID=224129 RepID=A0A1W4XNR8_AGRPL|nr:neuroligin-4, Y-linked isoform X2 [Agrilus planipennis]